ncbi:hypothetical protein ASG51_01025 [Methylobacterium sp. Leaf465]|jgi:hypothetical protein|nr:hypothetical protein ASF18_11120 [Methylobacterium sp. Leaf89]KQO74218.1 hypothetical protein ASF20_02730 [Methylobacterium sp. Leaf88]KQP54338.1 hypothetical protein ASF41_11640 [Methylobacterium sp. Leaf111]KQT84704.1 hypothetical protein ASG51_01025 [Methylobacterium sp. Leaf465]KQU35225.1 hypothetical protein ASG63_00885 [Methylobacterium sp. Leaf94]
MPQPAQTNLKMHPASEPVPLRALIDAAVEDRTTPISRLLRLMAALDADTNDNENLRHVLRARIGAPLSV